jgi:hypothetical protein
MPRNSCGTVIHQPALHTVLNLSYMLARSVTPVAPETPSKLRTNLAGALGEPSCNLMASGELGSELSSEDSMAKAWKTGDRVAWRSSGGESAGRVERKLTSPGKIKGHEIAASEDNPEFLVRSEKSSKIAAHKPSALRRVK